MLLHDPKYAGAFMPSCVDPGGRKDLAWLGRDGSQQK
jgi:hypothetical protein